ncbi:cache domain-containing sensor histidine kinase [Paenibacillus humicola]|uniref:cache domain-containing sensor histidine kinase n=1 Tax=Paenibacillus humicola TaxID=3110540 RepID=UPI00237A18A4|nr:sensor histidine kinase [Paenibacillus humicola]
MRLQLEKLIIGFTRRLNLRSKILTLYVLILLLPTLALGSGAVYMIMRSFHHSYLVAADESVRQTAKIVDFSKMSYELLAVRSATDGELIARLSRDYTDMADIVDTVNYVDRTFLITSKYLPGIADFRIYHTNETLVQDGQLLWRPEARMVSGMDERAWYKEVSEDPHSLRWSTVPGNPNQIILTRKIIDNSGTLLGVVYILLNYDAVFGELFDHPFDNGGSLYIVDDNGRVLAATERERIGSRIKADWPDEDASQEPQAATADGGKEQGTDTAQAGSGASGGTPVLDLTGTKELLIAKPLSSGWHVVALIHMKYMDDQNRAILLLIVGVTAFFLLLSISLMMTIVKNIVYRIRKLGTRMSDVSRGDFEVTVRNWEQDELGELEKLFNSMSERLGRLVEDITQAGLVEREQAFKALQAQINPHFIYNSLGLLRWRALSAQDEEQIRIIDALTTFYRLTLNNRISAIRIRDELEHVKAYLDICEFRYPGRVRVEWDIDEAALDYYTIKTILQPIVENCYVHGAIFRKPDAVIRISVRKAGDEIGMSVFDNGKGIPADRLKELDQGTYIGKGNGFGTANIKERLALYFGGDASFLVESVSGQWTRVTVKFPASFAEPALRREP